MAGLRFPKPEPIIVTKRRREKWDAKAERAAREIVRKRDGGHCRIPNCRERTAHLHHVTYRSKSRSRRWDPRNLASLCADHHALVHAGVIHISGDADAELVITGNVDCLKFRI